MSNQIIDLGDCPESMTTSQVADKLGIPPYSVGIMIRSGKLGAIALGGGSGQRHYYRVTKQQLTEFVESSTIGPRKKTITPKNVKPTRKDGPITSARDLVREVRSNVSHN